MGSAIQGLRQLVRPLAIGGGAASVSALMGIPRIAARAAAMLTGGLIGWGVNGMFQLI